MQKLIEHRHDLILEAIVAQEPVKRSSVEGFAFMKS
jgi:hypothetical protein